jgi:hypothetical protein
MVKAFFHNVAANGISEETPLVPEDGFAVRVTSHTISPTELQVFAELADAFPGFNPDLETHCQFAAVVSLSDPLDSKADSFKFLPIVSPPLPFVLDNPADISIPLTPDQGHQFSQYAAHTALVALITLTAKNVPVRHSSTMFLS